MAGGTAVVARGDLVITVTEGGNLRAKDSISIMNEVEGSSVVAEVVADGTYVKEGDVLLRMDSKEIEDRKAEQQTRLHTLEADYKAAQEDLLIQENEAQSKINQAQQTAEFARIDLQKYTEGDWPQQKRQAEDDIRLALQEEAQAKDQLDGTEELLAADVATRQQLTADKLALERAKSRLTQAQEKLRLLERFENPKQLQKLKSDHEESLRELERTKRRMESVLAQKKASLASVKDRLDIQKVQFEKTMEQAGNTEIRAPKAGMIVFEQPERWRNEQQPLAVGVKIYYRQKLMTLPDLSAMEMDVQVHETEVERVRLGQKANITVDAFPERRYTGEVRKVAVMAGGGNWNSPDVKVYATVLTIDQGTEGLKPGMTAKAEILCNVIKDKLLVPVTGVRVLRGRTAAIVQNGGGLEIREVKIGETNDKFVIVESGLKEGETVYLYEPPKAMPEVPWTETKPEKPAVAVQPPIPPPPGEEGAQGPANGGTERPERGQRTGRGGSRGGDMAERFRNMTPEERQRAIEEARRRRGGAEGRPADVSVDTAAPARPPAVDKPTDSAAEKPAGNDAAPKSGER